MVLANVVLDRRQHSAQEHHCHERRGQPEPISAKRWRIAVGHVSNVPGTLETCPTYFCADPKLAGLLTDLAVSSNLTAECLDGPAPLH